MLIQRKLLAAALLLVSGAFAAAQQAPDSGVTNLAGESVHVFSQPPDAITVLFFLRSDCPVGNRYAPEIQRLAAEYQARGVRFVLVYPDASDSMPNVRANVKAYYGGAERDLTIVRDPGHELVRASHVNMMPEAAVFRGTHLVYSGRIDDRVVGLGQWRSVATVHDLANGIDAAISDKPAKPAGGPAYGCFIADAQ